MIKFIKYFVKISIISNLNESISNFIKYLFLFLLFFLLIARTLFNFRHLFITFTT